MSPSEFAERLSPTLPEGIGIVEVFDLGASRKSLTSAMRSAVYSVKAEFERPADAGALENALNGLLSGEIVVQKRTKGGIKPVDIRPMVLSAALVSCEDRTAVFTVKGVLSAEGGLNPEMLLNAMFERIGEKPILDTSRLMIEMDRDLLLE